jgi:hypothetical protein
VDEREVVDREHERRVGRDRERRGGGGPDEVGPAEQPVEPRPPDERRRAVEGSPGASGLDQLHVPRQRPLPRGAGHEYSVLILGVQASELAQQLL